MVLELEKILTISVRDYCEMYGRKLSDFEPIGVSYIGTTEASPYTTLLRHFAKAVPDRAEVVVDLRFSLGGHVSGSAYCIVSGTALIPKKK